MAASRRDTNVSIIDDSEYDNNTPSSISGLFDLKKQITDKDLLEEVRQDNLETENLILRRMMPRLRDLHGKDITNQVILMEQRLNKKEDRIEQLEAQLYEIDREKKSRKELQERQLEAVRGVAPGDQVLLLHEQLNDKSDKIEQLEARLHQVEQERRDWRDQRRQLLKQHREEVEAFTERCERLKQKLTEVENRREHAETMSEKAENLDEMNAAIRRDVDEIDRSTPDSVSSNLQISFATLESVRQTFLSMFQSLKAIPEMIRQLSELKDNPEFNAIADKINHIVLQAENHMQLVTDGINDVENVDDSLHVSESHSKLPFDLLKSPSSSRHPTLEEYRTLRSNFEREVNNKEMLKKQLESRIRELADEKVTLQNQLVEIAEAFESLKRLKKEDEGRIKELSQLLNEARNDVKQFTAEKVNVYRELEMSQRKMDTYSKQMESLLNEKAMLKNAVDDKLAEIEYCQNALENQDRCLKKLGREMSEFEANRERNAQADGFVNGQKDETIKQLKRDLDVVTKRANRLHSDCAAYQGYLMGIVKNVSTGTKVVLARPDLIDEKAHKMIVDLLEATDNEHLQEFARARNIFVEVIPQLLTDRSDVSEVTAQHVQSTIGDIVKAMADSEEQSTHLVNLLKAFEKQDPQVNVQMMLSKGRELRNVLHVSAKAMKIRQDRIAAGHASGDFVQQLNKLHDILNHAPVVTKACKTRRDFKKGADKLSR